MLLRIGAIFVADVEGIVLVQVRELGVEVCIVDLVMIIVSFYIC